MSQINSDLQRHGRERGDEGVTTLHHTGESAKLRVSDFHRSSEETQDNIQAAFRKKMEWQKRVGCTVEGAYGSIKSLMAATFCVCSGGETDVCITYEGDSANERPKRFELGYDIYLYLLSREGYAISVLSPEEAKASGKPRVTVRKPCRSQRLKG